MYVCRISEFHEKYQVYYLKSISINIPGEYIQYIVQINIQILIFTFFNENFRRNIHRGT